MTDEQAPGLTRRDFLKTTAGTTAGAVAGAMLLSEPVHAQAPAIDTAGRILGANDRINFAMVGVNGMGGGHLRNLVGELASENVQITAICDVWEKARRQAGERAKVADEALYVDYRKMLERKDIDAVVVATPDQTHAQVAIAAMQTGRHVYCEKPMTHALDEAFRMYDVATTTNRLVQVGSHGLSDTKYLKAREVVKTGVLGPHALGPGQLLPQHPQGRVELRHRSRVHRADGGLGALAGPGAEAAVQRRTVLPVAKILGLRQRHHRRPVAAPAAPAADRDESPRVPEGGDLHRRQPVRHGQGPGTGRPALG